jgi:hypothetical protein
LNFGLDTSAEASFFLELGWRFVFLFSEVYVIVDFLVFLVRPGLLSIEDFAAYES